MKFLNRNAYIMTAVYGKNFCWSAKEAFKLLFRNLARVVVLDKVTDFLLLLGKLVIVGGVGVASFYVFSGRLQVRFLFNVIRVSFLSRCSQYFRRKIKSKPKRSAFL
mgnify:CR=1 FL=1